MERLKERLYKIKNELLPAYSKEDRDDFFKENFDTNILRISIFSFLKIIIQIVYGLYIWFSLSIGGVYIAQYFSFVLMEVAIILVFLICIYFNKGFKINNRLFHLCIILYLTLESIMILYEIPITGNIMRYFLLVSFILYVPMFSLFRSATYVIYSFLLLVFSLSVNSDYLHTTVFNVAFYSFLTTLMMFFTFVFVFYLQLKIHTLLKKTIEESKKIFDSNAELLLLNYKLESLATTDHLTQIPNRRAFDDYLKKVWGQCQRESRAVSIMIIDIDYFKKFNDNYGHLVGDQTLKEVAACICNNYKRNADLLARYGGEEFGAVIPFSDKDNLYAFGEKIRQAVEDLTMIEVEGNTPIKITVSIGIATRIPTRDLTITDMIGLADAALYKAKDTGKNKVVLDSDLSIDAKKDSSQVN